MIVLSYFGILCLIPLLVEKDDREVQWHAKHGLVLTLAWIVLAIAIGIVVHVIPFAGCVLWLVWPLIGVLHIICIMKGINGERFLVPGLSQFVERF